MTTTPVGPIFFILFVMAVTLSMPAVPHAKQVHPNEKDEE
jgi:hypothetical protein